MCLFSCILGASTSWNPQGLSRSVQGLLYWRSYVSHMTGVLLGFVFSVFQIKPYQHTSPIPLAVRSKARVCGRSPDEIVGSNPTGCIDDCLLWVLCVVRYRGLCDELITRPKESYRLWCVVVFYLKTSWMRRPWPTGGCCAKQKKISTPH
jgi:hypothetical protein